MQSWNWSTTRSTHDSRAVLSMSCSTSMPRTLSSRLGAERGWGRPSSNATTCAGEDHRFAVRAAGTTIRGWYGLAEPEGRGVDYVPGLRCYKLGRLIAGGEFFGHPNAVQVSGMARLVGEIDLAPVPLMMNKSDFAR